MRSSVSRARFPASYQRVKKQHLSTKTCATCGRPFTWRKRWKRVWDEVKYCSRRCRGERKSQ